LFEGGQEFFAELRKNMKKSEDEDIRLFRERVSIALIEYKRDNKTSNAKIGLIIGVTENTISNWIEKTSGPTPPQLKKIADITRKDLQWFLINESESEKSEKISEGKSAPYIDVTLMQSDLHTSVETMSRFSKVIEEQQKSIREEQARIKDNQTLASTQQETIDRLTRIIINITNTTDEQQDRQQEKSEDVTQGKPHKKISLPIRRN
jgi:transcriptional regulator with XRE-family HTH domain